MDISSSSTSLLPPTSPFHQNIGNSSNDNNNNEDGSDPSAQVSVLLWNIGIGYLPLTALICYAVISHDTRSSLATLRTKYILGERKNDAIHGALRLLIGSYLLRIGWMGLLSQNFANKLTGPSCYTGIDCGGQIFHSALNRFSALLYFMALCKIGPSIGSSWLNCNPQNLHNLNLALIRRSSSSIPSSSSTIMKLSLYGTIEWIPPLLEWDMSLLATDGFLIVLQLFLIILSLALPNNLPSYSPIYEAFQFQVATLSALLSLWFLSFGIYVLKEHCNYYTYKEHKTKIKQQQRNNKQRDQNNYEIDNDNGMDKEEDTPTSDTYSSSSKWTWKNKNTKEQTPLLSTTPNNTSSSTNTNINNPISSESLSPSPQTTSTLRKNSPRLRYAAIYIPSEELSNTIWGEIAQETAKETKLWCTKLFNWNYKVDINNSSCLSFLYYITKIPLPAYYTSFICIFIALLYGLRLPLFLYSSFVTSYGTSWTSYLYPYFYYTIPEILPPLLLIQISMPGGIQNIRRWYDKIY